MEVRKRNIAPLILFFLPGFVYYLILLVYPIIDGIVLSTYKFPTLNTKVFNGIGNYINVFSSSLFWNSMKNSLIFMLVTTIFQISIGYVLGYFIYLQLRGYRFFKTVFFMPNILAAVAVGFIWSYIFSPSIGLYKPFMEFVMRVDGTQYVSPLARENGALWVVMLAHVWHACGTQIILFNSGFMNMPEEVLESAAIDGASGLKMHWYMIMPLSWDVVKMVIILQITGALRAFDLIYVMTNGGPNHATEVLPLHLFVNAFHNFNIGYGSVIGVILFVITMGITLLLRRIMHAESVY